MRIVRNIGHVKKRRSLGRWSALLGFVMLGSTFLLIFFPTQILVAYGLLLVGFISFNFGMQQLGKWSNTARHPRNDLAIDEKLQTLSDKYVALHYMRFGKKVIEHIVIYPGGLLVIAARDIPGVIVGRGNKWRRKSIGFMRLFGLSGPQLGNPSFEADESIALLQAQLKEAKLEFDVLGAILFTAPNVELDLEDTDYYAMTLDELADFVREIDQDPTFKTTDRDALAALLSNGEELERTERTTTRRPVKVKRRTAAAKPGAEPQ